MSEQPAFTTHFCLVSDQVVPNLLPAFDDNLRPQRMVLLVSEGMRGRAGSLQMSLKRAGVSCEQWPIDDPWDADHLRRRINEYLATHGTEGLALNVTGGTKIMSYIAQEIFQERKLPIFYVHPEQNRVIWLTAGYRSFEIDSKIGIETFIETHGYKVQAANREPSRR